MGADNVECWTLNFPTQSELRVRDPSSSPRRLLSLSGRKPLPTWHLRSRQRPSTSWPRRMPGFALGSTLWLEGANGTSNSMSYLSRSPRDLLVSHWRQAPATLLSWPNARNAPPLTAPRVANNSSVPLQSSKCVSTTIFYLLAGRFLIPCSMAYTNTRGLLDSSISLYLSPPEIL